MKRAYFNILNRKLGYFACKFVVLASQYNNTDERRVFIEQGHLYGLIWYSGRCKLYTVTLNGGIEALNLVLEVIKLFFMLISAEHEF